MRYVNNRVYMSTFCKRKCFDWLVVGMRVYLLVLVFLKKYYNYCSDMLVKQKSLAGV